MQTLYQMFPKLAFAGPAERFLEKCDPSNVIDMIKERRISKIKMAYLSCSGGALRVGKDGNFFIIFDDHLPTEKALRVVGHEIAHTFHHNLTYQPPRNILSFPPPEEIDDFCKEFADRFAEKVDIDTLYTLISRMSPVEIVQAIA